jgi:hypothetical protein
MTMSYTMRVPLVRAALALTILAGCPSKRPDVPANDASGKRLPAAVMAHLKEHLAEAPELRGMAPGAITPLFRPDLGRVAYYDVRLDTNGKTTGYVILASGPHDAPVVQWSITAESPVADVQNEVARAGVSVAKYYFLDQLTFAAEDPSGQLVAWRGDHVPGTSTQRRPGQKEWLALKKGFSRTYKMRLKSIGGIVTDLWDSANDCPKSWTTHIVGNGDADQLWLDQMDAGDSPNDSGCWSGCGATAWTMLFGWADTRANAGEARWATSGKLYKTLADAMPSDMTDDTVRDMMWTIRGHLDTACIDGSGLTRPDEMDRSQEYLDDHDSTANVDVGYQPSTYPSWTDDADRVIRDERPAIIILGVEHYPLAYGYRKKDCRLKDKHEFLINEGWGGTGGRWTSDGTWFMGELKPPQSSSGSSSTPSTGDCPHGSRCCEPRLFGSGGCLICRDNDMDCP